MASASVREEDVVEISNGKLALSFACGRYDRMEPIQTGEVPVEGVTVLSMILSPADTFLRVARGQEFDMAEMSLSGHILHTARQDSGYVGLPVVTSRTFRHQGIVVRKEIEDLRQLEGMRVAVPEYHMTAALFMRGLLMDDLGFDHRSVIWVQAGQYSPGRLERESLSLPPDVRVERVADRTIDEMLYANEVQAALSPYRSRLFDLDDCPIRPYFADPRAAAEDWFRRTGILPIMHLVVVRKSIVERHPWVAANLVKAFTTAKDLCLERMTGNGGHPPVALPFLLEQIDEARRLLGDDIWPYGVEANRTTLAAACRYSYEQGLSDRLVPVEELFAPEVVAPPFID